MDGKGHSDDVSNESENHVIGKWRKGSPGYTAAKNLAELCLGSSVLWKLDLASNTIV